MPDTDEKFYQVQEGFRITYEGERAGLYKLFPLANGETEELWIGEPLWIGGIVDDEKGGKGLALEWLDPDKRRHSLVIPEKTFHSLRFSSWLLKMAGGGWRTMVSLEKERKAFFQFLRTVWNEEYSRREKAAERSRKPGRFPRLFLFADYGVGQGSPRSFHARSAAPSMRESRGISLWQDGVA